MYIPTIPTAVLWMEVDGVVPRAVAIQVSKLQSGLVSLLKLYWVCIMLGWNDRHVANSHATTPSSPMWLIMKNRMKWRSFLMCRSPSRERSPDELR